MVAQPTGTVTLLFTDVEGSTQLLTRLGAERYAEMLELHRRLLRGAFAAHGGYEVDEEGDALFVAFAAAADAVAAAADGQQALAAADWPEGCGALRVRMGVHTGEPLVVPPKYVGMDVHRTARIMSATHGGQVLISDTTAALVHGVLLRDLGQHRLKDLLAPVRLFQLEIDGLPGEFPPLRSLQQTNLPIAAWPLLGRKRELEAIRSLVSDGVRLVTLTGPGGSGKTRLGLQAAADLSEEFADGVFFTSLAPLRDTLAVKAAAAEAVGLQPDDDLTAWLASRRTLLVLDNLEHLPGVDAVVGELLVGGTTVLATSRTSLRLSGEHELPIEPLAENAAVELFVTRAAAAGRPIEANETVVAVCSRLDNLPLALELAAARAKLLSPTLLLERLDQALPLLTGGASDRPERQRTLRATIAWSHDLLEPEAQAAFRRLSVFRGSFSLQAAEAITETGLDTIGALVDQSLVKPFDDDRFFLLETIREFAREQLDDAAETETYRERHANWYEDQLERNGLSWFIAEEDNLRAMLDRLAATDPDRAVAAKRQLWGFWRARGSYPEWSERHATLLAADGLSEQARRSLLLDEVRLALFMGDREKAERAAEDALKAVEGIGGEDEAVALILAAPALGWRDRDRGAQLALEARTLSEGLEDGRRSAVLIDVGIALAEAGRPDEARATTHEAREGFRRIQSDSGVAIATSNLGWFDLAAGEFEAAREAFASAQRIARRIGHRTAESDASRGLGLALLALRRREESLEAFSRMFEIIVEAGSDQPMKLDAAAGVALSADIAHAHQAARLRGAVAHLRQTVKRDWDLGSDEIEHQLEQQMIDQLGRERMGARARRWRRSHP